MAGRIDYAERQEQKKERYQERVEQAEQRSQAHYENHSKIAVGLSNICHTFLEINIIEIPCMIHKLYIVINSKYFSFGLFHSNGFIGKLLYSLDQYLSFSLKSSKLTNTLL